jgi:predicted negative regulator of RcsB-dependent stress response
MPDPNWKPEGAPAEGNRFLQKLGVYLLGVAIGLIFLGWVQYRKHQAAQAQRAAEVGDAPQDARSDAAPDESP